jgi:PIN domain nuclease of toxin-antitoxin system
VRALLDTHAFIWWVNDDPSLTHAAKSVISDSTNEIFFSAVSTWEMAIKIALGKLTLAMPLNSFVQDQILQYQFKPLLVGYEHTYRVQFLPQHHKDPFDRLLIAQALTEDLVILTVDPQFPQYGVQVAW